MKCMFLNCINLQNINLFSFDTKKVVDMSYMFKNCESLPNIPDLSSFDYYSVINKSYMFSGFYNLNKYEILSSDYSDYDVIFKIFLFGSSISGKEQLRNSCKINTKNINNDKMLLTVGFCYEIFNIRYKNKIIKLKIFDTSSQERISSIQRSFYQAASLILFVYGINNEYTFR